MADKYAMIEKYTKMLPTKPEEAVFLFGRRAVSRWIRNGFRGVIRGFIQQHERKGDDPDHSKADASIQRWIDGLVEKAQKRKQ